MIFTGRGYTGSRSEILAAACPEPPPVAELRQIHSALVLDANPGVCGEGDALVSDQTALALSIATADCVPVLLAGADGRIAAVHAGWRGIATGIVRETLRAFSDRRAVRAWVGPAIGACCYEVGDEVVAAVLAAAPEAVATSAATGPIVVRQRPGSRPHLDLQAAVASQLATAGVTTVETVTRCTRCHADSLWSYRRDGRAAGRNLAFIWRPQRPS